MANPQAVSASLWFLVLLFILGFLIYLSTYIKSDEQPTQPQSPHNPLSPASSKGTADFRSESQQTESVYPNPSEKTKRKEWADYVAALEGGATAEKRQSPQKNTYESN
jgi:hypothetical protein